MLLILAKFSQHVLTFSKGFSQFTEVNMELSQADSEKVLCHV